MSNTSTATQRFNAVTLRTSGYPFWGSNRAEYCGHPSFWLDCSNNDPLINITYMNYRVLEINNSPRTLRVARSDYLDTICPPTIVNTTIDFNLFSYSTTNATNLTLYYNCQPSASATAAAIFTPFLSIITPLVCEINNTNSVNYYMNSTIQNLIGIGLGICSYRVKVPVLAAAAQTAELAVTQAEVITAINGGFMLEWIANNPQCDECVGAGGLCGSDPTTKAFACHCINGTFTSGCSGAVSTGKHPICCH
uniref:non-specific serine/threonine protein kinase n=1 Tax=Fagus sylvatica TaxID=28930 RepID=A0A2N9EBP3_FAGSY